MKEMLAKQGENISRFITGSTRMSIARAIQDGAFTKGFVADSVQNGIDEAMQHPGIKSINVIDDNFKILASSEPDRIGLLLPKKLQRLTEATRDRAVEQQHHQIIKTEDSDEKVFQYVKVKRFKREMFERDWGHGRHSIRKIRGEDFERYRDKLSLPVNDELTILIELNMAPMEQAVKRQLIQIVGLSLVLLLVGIGGWLSINTLQRLKGSQTRLKSVEAFRNQLVGSLPVGLLATDDRMRVQVVNDVACQLMDISETVVFGRDIRQVLPKEIWLRLENNQQQRGELIHFEYSYHDKEGGKRVYDVYSQKIFGDEMAEQGTIILLQDLTDKKNLEVDLQRSERFAALGKVAAGVAHELRNPLSSIKGLALLTRKKLVDDSQGQLNVDMMVKEVERLDRSIKELLEFARPEQLHLEPVKIAELVRDGVNIFSTDFSSGNIVVNVEEQDDDCLVKIDVDKIKQVFLNLFLNSIQAMKDGGELNIFIGKGESGVECVIKDNGCGIDQDILPKVFDPYFTTKNEGTGLGLALSAKIVEEHDGSLEIKSQLNKGTTVTLRLPAYLNGSSGGGGDIS